MQAVISFLSTIGYEVSRQGFNLSRISPTENSIIPHETVAFLGPLERMVAAAQSSADEQTAKGLLEAVQAIKRALFMH